MQRLSTELNHQLNLQDRDQAAQLKRLAATGDQEIRRLVEVGLQERETLAMQIASGDRERVAGAMVEVFKAEAQLRGMLLANPQMPAGERAAYERAISSLGDPLRAFVYQLYAPPPPPPAPAPPPPVPAPGPLPSPVPGGAPIMGAAAVGGLVPPSSYSYYPPEFQANLVQAPAAVSPPALGVGGYGGTPAASPVLSVSSPWLSPPTETSGQGGGGRLREGQMGIRLK
jgi:hypothetical protein